MQFKKIWSLPVVITSVITFLLPSPVSATEDRFTLSSPVSVIFELQKMDDISHSMLVETNIAFHEAWVDDTNKPASLFLIECAALLGDPEALWRLINIYAEPSVSWLYGLDLNGETYEKSRLWNDKLVAAGNPKAIRRAVYGYSYGLFGYWDDLDSEGDRQSALAQAKGLVERYVIEENEWAYKLMLEGWAHGIYGFAKDRERALKWNHERVERGDEAALKREIDGLGRKNNDYGYEYSPKRARELIELHTKKGALWAIKRQAIGHSTGYYGFDINPGLAREIIIQLTERDYYGAKKLAVRGYIWGCHGFPKHLEKGYELARKWGVYDFGDMYHNYIESYN